MMIVAGRSDENRRCFFPQFILKTVFLQCSKETESFYMNSKIDYTDSKKVVKVGSFGSSAWVQNVSEP